MGIASCLIKRVFNLRSKENLTKHCWVVIGDGQGEDTGLRKKFLRDIGARTSEFETFDNSQNAIEYIKGLPEGHEVVVKASGLAAGKGVIIPSSRSEAIEAARSMLDDKSFGSTACSTIVIERMIHGDEASMIAFCDGNCAVLLPPAQDHKREGDGDTDSVTTITTLVTS